jgi:hypothetical protein
MLKKIAGLLALCLFAAACTSSTKTSSVAVKASPLAPTSLSEVVVDKIAPLQSYEISKKAYIYAYPMVKAAANYNKFFFDTNSPEFKAAVNTVAFETKLPTPLDVISYPDADMLHAYAFLDLRQQPFVITIPKFGATRYFSMEVKDLYTQIAGFAGKRDDGTAGYKVLVAGPSWTGTAVEGVTKIIKSETDFALITFRTQVLNKADLPKALEYHKKYAAVPLNVFLKTQAPLVNAELTEFPIIDEAGIHENMFDYLAMLLKFCPTNAAEVELRKGFDLIGIESGSFFTLEDFTEGTQKAIINGKNDAAAEIKAAAAKITDFANYFGTRSTFANNLLNRAAIADVGFNGTAKEEIYAFMINTDANGNALDGALNTYKLTFAKGKFPQTKAFWSVTVYTKEGLLSANKSKIYSINSRMFKDLKHNTDGSLTIDIQNAASKGRTKNWLPEPSGEFVIVLRNYIPLPAMYDGSWQQPKITAKLKPGAKAKAPAPAATPKTATTSNVEVNYDDSVTDLN